MWIFSGLVENPANAFAESSTKRRHIYDEAGILPKYDIQKFEEYTNWIFNESDIDIRFVFVKDIGNNTIDEFAVKKVQELGIGAESQEERGVLLLYDLTGNKLRVEVGYGLEEYFPDAFVGYLVHDHAHDFFSMGDLSKGLRLLIRMLHHRIREEVLGNSFDPRVVETIRHHGYLSGGGGFSTSMPERARDKAKRQRSITEEARQSYSPQPTPQAVYEKYLQWLAVGVYDPRIDIFTPESQSYMASLPMTKAYSHYILMQEYGRNYKIYVRNNVALLYFTDDPLICPHFFRKTGRGWQMDILAEVDNTRNRVGGVYTWDYRGRSDIYTKTFSDKLINIKNYIRIVDGDNREIPIRSSP